MPKKKNDNLSTGLRIIALREKMGMSQAEFARFLEIQSATLSYIEKNMSDPSLGVIRQILNKVPTVNPFWLIMGVEPMMLAEGELVPQSITQRRDDDDEEDGSLKDRYVKLLEDYLALIKSKKVLVCWGVGWHTIATLLTEQSNGLLSLF